MNGSDTRTRPGARSTRSALVAVVVAALAVAGVLAAPAAGAKGSTPKNAMVRFVNTAVTADYPDGTPVDVYLATSFTAQAATGGKVTAVKPAPKKLVPKLAFGAATKYLAVPISAAFFVTAAGKPDILASGGVDAAANGVGFADTYGIATNGDPVTADTGTTTTTGTGYMSPLSLTGYDEQVDFTYSNGTGRPIKDAAVLLTHTNLTAGHADGAWQMGVVGKGCLPEFLTNGNQDANNNPETLGVSSKGGLGVEYVASEPGSLELGLWPGPTTDCSGTPVASATANVTAGSRSYLYWYGPADSPKLLVVSLQSPKGEKFATNSSPSAYTGSSNGSSDTGSSGDSSSTTTSDPTGDTTSS